VIYIAPNRFEAERIREILAREGLLCKPRLANLSTISDTGCVEILVPEAEAEEALDILQGVLER
jgi:hypothetical protein